MSHEGAVEAVKSIATKQPEQTNETYVNQKVSDGAKQKMHYQLNGGGNASEFATNGTQFENTVGNLPINQEMADDLLQMRKLREAYEALQTTPIERIPGAAAQVTYLSMITQFKMEGVKELERRNDSNISSLLRNG